MRSNITRMRVLVRSRVGVGLPVEGGPSAFACLAGWRRALNNFHHWLNRITLPLARRVGIGALDLTNYTLGETASGAIGDLYHGYSRQAILRPFLQGVCEECACISCGAPPTRAGALQPSTVMGGRTGAARAAVENDRHALTRRRCGYTLGA